MAIWLALPEFSQGKQITNVCLIITNNVLSSWEARSFFKFWDTLLYTDQQHLFELPLFSNSNTTSWFVMIIEHSECLSCSDFICLTLFGAHKFKVSTLFT